MPRDTDEGTIFVGICCAAKRLCEKLCPDKLLDKPSEKQHLDKPGRECSLSDSILPSLHPSCNLGNLLPWGKELNKGCTKVITTLSDLIFGGAATSALPPLSPVDLRRCQRIRSPSSPEGWCSHPGQQPCSGTLHSSTPPHTQTHLLQVQQNLQPKLPREDSFPLTAEGRQSGTC